MVDEFMTEQEYEDHVRAAKDAAQKVLEQRRAAIAKLTPDECAILGLNMNCGVKHEPN